MVEVRRHLHRYPELANEEVETQRFLREALHTAGFHDVGVVAGTGLYLDIVGGAGASRKMLAIRADLDALPISEQADVAFRSTNDGMMHACGHDAHAAMVFAAALELNRTRDQFAGTVRVIFQPAEEDEPLGGRRVVREGLLDDVDATIGMHVDPYTPTGVVAVGPGPYTLACDIFDITITGEPGHAAKPNEAVDAIAVGAAVVSELQKIVARETDPFDPLIVSITNFVGGTGAYNILAGNVTMKGTIRSANEQTRNRAQRRVGEISRAIAAAHGATAEFSVVRGEPPVVNDQSMSELIVRAVTEVGGADAVIAAPGWTVADDFGFFSEKRPSVYFRLGIRNAAAGSTFPIHHPKFLLDEAAMPLGAATLMAAARLFLA